MKLFEDGEDERGEW